MRGRDGYINLAVGKFGVRAQAQSMARELGPKGVHVAHVVIDGGIFSSRSNPGAAERMSSLFPEEIANSVFHLHRQHPSAWSQEIDLRPWVEKF
jgi:NADP-dependent 3-hydroxy acid dehydrogenase YdfG